MGGSVGLPATTKKKKKKKNLGLVLPSKCRVWVLKKDTDTKHAQRSQHRAECGLRNAASSGGDSQKRWLIAGVKGRVLQVNSNETLPSHSDSTLEARVLREPHPLAAPFTHGPGSFQGSPQAS